MLFTVCVFCVLFVNQMLSFFFFKQKTAYEMRISDWSSDVCSSDLRLEPVGDLVEAFFPGGAGHAGIHVGVFVGLARNRGLEVQAGVADRLARRREIGRASCGERVCQYV